jgi:alpha-mannosidase
MTSFVSPLNASNQSAFDQITSTIHRLRGLTQIDVQSQWRYCLAELPVAEVMQADWGTWAIASLNPRYHIPWAKGRQVLWLVQRLVIPHTWQGYPLQGLALRLALSWWAETAQIFVNGEWMQAGDLFDCSTRILLTSSVQPGETFDVALRLVSPGHDEGALVRSTCVYEIPSPHLESCPEPGFMADELAVVQSYLTTFAPDQLRTLAAALPQIDWAALPDRPAFDQSLIVLRQMLKPLGDWLKQRHIGLLGHAHLDMAWLWPVDETWQAAERTFQSVLQLQQDFSELIFCHSTPALYAWMEEHRPALFAAMRDQIAAGRWEVVAGLWIEPEVNLISGESLVRQVLYGQRYGLEKFGRLSAIAWLPDSFGFPWQLPQILVQGGMQYFVTQKLRWNDTTEFPYDLFWWRSPDGSQILSLNSARIGEGIDPVSMATYACDWERKTGIPFALWLPGVGDHGGGPTRDMLETARRWQRSPFFPTLEFRRGGDYLEKIRGQEAGVGSQESRVKSRGSGVGSQEVGVGKWESGVESRDSGVGSGKVGGGFSLPVWDDELYLEFHRGCYTTHADQKRWNRSCERSLYQAELFAALATLIAGTLYPQAEIEALWKQVLFNQFHDILPGSAIPEVFEDANQAWREVEQVSHQILEEALDAIAHCINLSHPPAPDSQPIVVFNPLNWERSEVVAIALSAVSESEQDWQVCDADGHDLDTQRQQISDGSIQLLFRAMAVPGVGYRVFWLKRSSNQRATGNPQSSSSPSSVLHPQTWILENDILRVTVDSQTGDLSSIFDQVQQREILSAPGNQLQAFRDSGQYWDAWNIDPNYAQHPLPAATLKSIHWLDRGPLQFCLRVVRQLGRSRFCQDYILAAGSAVLKIVTTVDWQERQVLVKAAFPLHVAASYATYEIPCGAIARPTNPAEPQEKAKWEVPALQWADLSDAEYGVSLLNDCKHGYDSQPSQLRLTLLRSASWPDPNADRGGHQFTYAIYPHSGSWQAAQTVRRGYELNQPMIVRCLNGTASRVQPSLPTTGHLLHLPVDNLIVMAFKQAEDHPTQWILRCYECHGERAELALSREASRGVLPVHRNGEIYPANLLEQPEPFMHEAAPFYSIQPWKIVTFIIRRC